jgi:hypothetical protein
MVELGQKDLAVFEVQHGKNVSGGTGGQLDYARGAWTAQTGNAMGWPCEAVQ